MDESIPHDVLKMHRSNIFEMEMPETYQCGIREYKATHSKLRISVYKKVPGDVLDLVFTGVMFYEGPMQWVGANFCVAPRDEWLTLMQELGWIEGAPQDAMGYLSEELR
ncbi:MAG: hypothetical protein MN733_07495, partial [Nitrososphaera sp.]|nr:hypothetical protein [Nitrososphaera sp.]